MLNLLPPDKKRAVQRLYWYRVATVTLTALLVALGAGGALLAPSLFLTFSREDEIAQRLTDAEQIAEQRGSEARQEVRATERILATLTKPQEHKRVYPLMENVLMLAPTGISLSGFFYEAGGADEKLIIKGVASRRDTLLAFAQTVREQEAFAGADLPISELVEQTNIPFTITIDLQ